MESPQDIAELLKTKWDLGLNGGVIVANPVPKDKQLDYDIMTKAINEAILLEKEQNINIDPKRVRGGYKKSKKEKKQRKKKKRRDIEKMHKNRMVQDTDRTKTRRIQ